MKPAICTQCGGLIEVDETKEAGICASCGTAFITEKVISNYITNNNTVNNITNINYGEKKDGDYEFKQAMTRLKLDDFDAAVLAIEKATEKAPENPKYWIYDAYIDTQRFTQIPTEWCYRGGYDSSKPINKSIEGVANFFALASDEDKSKYSAELGVDLSDFNRFGASYLTNIARSEKCEDAVIRNEVADFAMGLFEQFEEDDEPCEEQTLITKAIVELVCSYGIVFGIKDYHKRHNKAILDLVLTVVDFISDEDKDRLSDKVNPVTAGNRLNVFYAECCRGFKDGILTPDNSIEDVTVNIDGIGNFALYMHPGIKSIYVAPGRKITRIEYSPDCSPELIHTTFDKTNVHVIPAEWSTFTLREKMSGYIPIDYVLYFKGNTEIKAATITNNFSDPQTLRPVIVKNGKFGSFYHSHYKQYRTREYAEAMVKHHFPEEFSRGELSYVQTQKRGCYVATAVYGSYDCPEVWTLRRYRDDTLYSSKALSFYDYNSYFSCNFPIYLDQDSALIALQNDDFEKFLSLNPA